LLLAIDRKGSPVCVGLDPVHDRLPAALSKRIDGPDSALSAIAEFCSEVIDAVADSVPAVKLQSACFERYRHEGVEVLYSLIGEAQDRGLITILDAKRGDIGISASHYAASAFKPWLSPDEIEPHQPTPDAITVNGYLGADGIEPFCLPGRGVFVLVRTSNPGGDALQTLQLKDGSTVAEHMAAIVHEVGHNTIGQLGYSSVGAVVGATKSSEIEGLRECMPHAIFLVPGYGAQGGSADDVRAAFGRDGRGALITASRSVLYAFETNPAGDWVDAIGRAASQLAREVGVIAGGGSVV
jgi:orotidine-5'-phosphate decarboxylase